MPNIRESKNDLQPLSPRRMTIMTLNLEVLAYEETPLGILCLRRRLTLREPQQWVTEITLNHEFLMSSLHTESERSLATRALERLAADDLSVLIGGLGLGYTAAAVIEDRRVAQVEVVELLPQVIAWWQDGLVPLASQLRDEPRLKIVHGDVYQRLLSDPDRRQFDAILIDVDHSPEDQLSDSNQSFYSAWGLRLAARHLRDDGVLALWSSAGNAELESAMRCVFRSVELLPITYENLHVGETYTDWLFVAQR